VAIDAATLAEIHEHARKLADAAPPLTSGQALVPSAVLSKYAPPQRGIGPPKGADSGATAKKLTHPQGGGHG
jgi:hypothetical protein